MRVLVVGTGYVGLTTGVVLAYLGNEVVCLDVDGKKIAILQEGRSPIYEPGLPELMNQVIEKIKFTTSYDEVNLNTCDVIFIAVGTPSLPDGSCDLSHVEAAANAIGERLQDKFTIIVNKSTMPIGSGNWVGALLRDAYERCKGCKPNGTYAMASNPEFLRQGSAVTDTLYPERIVIGAEDPRAIELLTYLYQPLLNQDFPAPSLLPRPVNLRGVPLVTCDLTSAELIKYAANAFLAVKISFANEMAQLTGRIGADINQVMRGVGLDSRIGTRFLQAGIGWGGSCLGKDAAALVATSKEYGITMPITQAARDVNDRQRTWVVNTLLDELKILKGRTVALLGFAFKANTDDLRDAPSLDIARNLIRMGARVMATDPVALPNARRLYPKLGVGYHDKPLDALEGVDAIVLVAEWPEYRALDWAAIKPLLHIPLVLDGRNFLDREELTRLGYRYVGVGR
jgi:UDPglucose 6-dehydrogenase